MLEPRRPVSKFMGVAWLLSGPLNLILVLMLYMFFGKGRAFYGDDAVFELSVLALSCSFGMALSIYWLKAGAATRWTLFRTVFTSAILTTAMAVSLFDGWAALQAATEPSTDGYGAMDTVAIILSTAPVTFLYSLFFLAFPAALYGAVILMLVGYGFRARR